MRKLLKSLIVNGVIRRAGEIVELSVSSEVIERLEAKGILAPEAKRKPARGAEEPAKAR